MTAWSYSSLTAFETCPKRYFHTRVAKDIVEPEGDALLWGSAVHKALENRVKDGTPLPTGMTQWEPICAKLRASPGEIFTERQLCLNYRFQPTAWYGDDAWVRGVVDVGVLRDDEIVALDYKTGKPKPDTDQLQLFAALSASQSTFVYLNPGNSLSKVVCPSSNSLANPASSDKSSKFRTSSGATSEKPVAQLSISRPEEGRTSKSIPWAQSFP